MSIVLRARHAHVPPLSARLEPEVRFEDIPALFRLEGGKVVATPDEGAEVHEADGCIVVAGWVVSHDDAAPFAPEDERERALFAALAEKPNDDDVRQVYSDWLEENGHRAEAEVLALERRLRGPARDVNGLADALRKAASATTFGWRAIASRARVHGCESEASGRSWEMCAPTIDPFVRYCADCECHVVLLPRRDRLEVYRDNDFHVALDVAFAAAPVATTIWDGPVTALPFFANDRPPATVGEALRGLELLPHDSLQERGYGFFALPEAYEPAPSNAIARVSFGYASGTRLHPSDFQSVAFSVANGRRYTRVDLRFVRPLREVEAWLEERFGKPHLATTTAPEEADETSAYRVYEHWRVTANEHVMDLTWENPISEWALPPRDEEAALGFLRQLKKLLARWRGCSFAQLEQFALHPPKGAGIEIPERIVMRRDDVVLVFRPPLRALDVVAIFELEDTFVEHDGYDSITSTIRTRRSPHYHRWPQYGKWLVELVLTREDNERVSSRSRIQRLRVFPPY